MYFVLFAVFFCQIVAKIQGGAVDFLNEATFANSIKRSPHFVLFYAPWCGHCKSLLTSWNELGEKSNENPGRSKVKIAKVNCMEDVALCSEQNILAYPTMKLFKDGATKRFEGRRCTSEFTTFIKNTLDELVDIEVHEGLVTLTTNNFDAHTKTGLHFVEFFAPWCVHCKQLEPTWRAVAKHYEMNPDITICKMDCTVEAEKCQEHQISAFPMLKMFKDGEEVDNYKLSRNMDTLISYINSQLAAYGLTEGEGKVVEIIDMPLQMDELTVTVDRPEEEEEDELRELATAPFPDDSVQENNDEDIVEKEKNGEQSKDEIVTDAAVLELTDETFEALLVEPIFVMFYAPWCKHCQRLKPTWEKLGVIFQSEQGPIIARVDCSRFTGICQKYQITGYPTLVLFKDGRRYFYNEDRTLKSLRAFAKVHHDEL